jgi:hypothetical protein
MAQLLVLGDSHVKALRDYDFNMTEGVDLAAVGGATACPGGQGKHMSRDWLKLQGAAVVRYQCIYLNIG